MGALGNGLVVLLLLLAVWSTLSSARPTHSRHHRHLWRRLRNLLEPISTFPDASPTALNPANSWRHLQPLTDSGRAIERRALFWSILKRVVNAP